MSEKYLLDTNVFLTPYESYYAPNPPYAPFSDEELITAYLTNYAIYATEPYFFDWADEALIVHRKKKK